VGVGAGASFLQLNRRNENPAIRTKKYLKVMGNVSFNSSNIQKRKGQIALF
jgi:hypothetical protein